MMKYLHNHKQHKIHIILEKGSGGANKIYDGTWEDTYIGRVFSMLGKATKFVVKNVNVRRLKNDLGNAFKSIQDLKLSTETEELERIIAGEIGRMTTYINNLTEVDKEDVLETINYSINSLESIYTNSELSTTQFEKIEKTLGSVITLFESLYEYVDNELFLVEKDDVNEDDINESIFTHFTMILEGKVLLDSTSDIGEDIVTGLMSEFKDKFSSKLKGISTKDVYLEFINTIDDYSELDDSQKSDIKDVFTSNFDDILGDAVVKYDVSVNSLKKLLSEFIKNNIESVKGKTTEEVKKVFFNKHYDGVTGPELDKLDDLFDEYFNDDLLNKFEIIKHDDNDDDNDDDVDNDDNVDNDDLKVKLAKKFAEIFNQYVVYVLNESLKMRKLVDLKDEYKKLTVIDKDLAKNTASTLKSETNVNYERSQIYNIVNILKKAHEIYAITEDEYSNLPKEYGEKKGYQKQKQYVKKGNDGYYDKSSYNQWYKAANELLGIYSDYLTVDTKSLILDSLNSTDLFKSINDRMKKIYGVTLADSKPGNSRLTKTKLDDKITDTDLTKDKILEFKEVKALEVNNDKLTRNAIRLTYQNDSTEKGGTTDKHIIAYITGAKKNNGIQMKFVKGTSVKFLEPYLGTSGKVIEGMKGAVNSDVLYGFMGIDGNLTLEGSPTIMNIISCATETLNESQNDIYLYSIQKIEILRGQTDGGTFKFQNGNQVDMIKKNVNKSPYDTWHKLDK